MNRSQAPILKLKEAPKTRDEEGVKAMGKLMLSTGKNFN